MVCQVLRNYLLAKPMNIQRNSNLLSKTNKFSSSTLANENKSLTILIGQKTESTFMKRIVIFVIFQVK